MGQKSLGYDCGVATDSAGNLYVAQQNAGGSVHKLTPTGPATFTESGAGPYAGASGFPCQVAAGEGFVYVAMLNGAVRKIASEGGEEGETDYVVDNPENGAGPIAIDPTTGHLFVTNPFGNAEGNRPVREFDVSGASPVLVSLTSLATPEQGIAADGASGDIYVTREGHSNIEVYEQGAPPAEQPLTLEVNSGSGTTVSNPAGIECTGSTGKTCAAEFEEGAEVTLTASPAAGYRFYNWAACPGTTNGRQCTVTMSEAKEARVNFIKTWKLTVSKSSGSEDGIFKVLPSPGVVCPYKCQDATYSFTNGQEVEITRDEPSPVRHFAGWENGTGSAAGCTGTAPCTITLTEDSSIEGLFEENAKATLSLSKEGGGQASITSSPVGIYCLNSCGSASVDLYSEPTPEEVTLSWTLNAGTSSIEWTSGAGTCTGKSTSNGNCKVTMSEAHNLVAKLE